MKSLILVLVGLLASCRHTGWHLATKAECEAQRKREVEWMAKAGWEGDPPITLGMGWGSSDDHGHWYMTEEIPCGYTDGKEFRTLYYISVSPAGSQCELTEAQFHTAGSGGGEKLREACVNGKLPRVYR